jgi:CTP synthase
LNTKFIVITGGVLSGLGKGVVTASIGTLLSSQGYIVAPVKIDPYINIDAGTMRPTEHGEVFVTEDGGETDQDLGNYERFMDINVEKNHNITTGQVYETVIHRERNLEYHGKCVEVIPHIPQEVQRRIEEVGKNDKADFVLIEIGGTIGDYQSVLFLEAVRQMKMERNNMIFVHVVYLPVPRNIGEMKTKPAQHSVRSLMESGIQPDFLVGRSEFPIDDIRKDKLALFCNVKHEDVISAPDVDSIYKIPLLFDEQGFTKRILEKFGLTCKPSNRLEFGPDYAPASRLDEWRAFVHKLEAAKEKLKIAIIGKYFDIGDFALEDSYISVIESLKHACFANKMRPDIHWINSKDFEKDPTTIKRLDEYSGIIVPGGFGASGVEGKILAIRYARENNIPFLGLCLGLQLAVVEYARNVCNMNGAHSTEMDKNAKFPVIDILPEQKKNIELSNYGATMRLGSYKALLKPGSQVRTLYGSDEISERHRHRYEVNPEYIEAIENKGLVFSGWSPDRKLMEFIELPGHSYFVGTQAHPEFKSRPLKPHPLFNGFIKACIGKT